MCLPVLCRRKSLRFIYLVPEPIANHILSLLDNAPAMSMAESFERLCDKKIIPPELGQNLKKAVGFRNLSVHAYDKIDWHLLWNILEEDLKDLVRFLECVECFDH
jgi:uncharacterized protein YutE (UPF0331/DUF86 family)